MLPSDRHPRLLQLRNALMRGHVVPPDVAHWLLNGLDRWTHQRTERVSLDTALGLPGEMRSARDELLRQAAEELGFIGGTTSPWPLSARLADACKRVESVTLPRLRQDPTTWATEIERLILEARSIAGDAPLPGRRQLYRILTTSPLQMSVGVEPCLLHEHDRSTTSRDPERRDS